MISRPVNVGALVTIADHLDIEDYDTEFVESLRGRDFVVLSVERDDDNRIASCFLGNINTREIVRNGYGSKFAFYPHELKVI